MPSTPHNLKRRSIRWIYLGAILAVLSIILPIAIIHHVFILDDFTPTMLAAPLAVSVIVGSLFGTILWLRQQLQEQSRVFKILADSSREFSYVRGLDERYLYISPSVEPITGYTVEEFANNPLGMDAIIHIGDKLQWDKYPPNTDNSNPKAIELRILTKSGDIRWLSHFSQVINDERGNIIGLQSSNIDITERKQHESRILHMAEYDPLTDLPNRRYLTRFMQDLTDTRQEEAPSFAVLFMDLNRFKYVNDAYGHSFGDKLLQTISQNLQAICKTSSLLCRFGGDEFVIIAKQFTTLKELEQKANDLVAQLEQPINIDDHTVNIGASIGIAIYPYDGAAPEELIKNADTAMFRAKKAGLNCQFFSTEMAEHAITVLSLESRLREAVQSGAIELHYQPQFSIASGKVIGLEALARWTDSSGLGISPLTFIAIAEETGLIIPLGQNLLRKALEQIRMWHEQGLDLRVAVNVSARQFLDKDFVVNTIQLVKDTGAPIHLLEIELTESALLEDRDAAIKKLQQLRDAGISIALDDFGTGHSSLSYLHQLPLDIVKIDQSFIFGMLQDPRHEVICKAITHLAHDLDLQVVAEGIETEEHLEKLQEFGCDIGQGYLFSKPLPADQLAPVLSKSLATDNTTAIHAQ
jgi:diguanylate cyclase (GGDEF)-like protein/PAS domain S-box-containing protein